MTRHPDSARRRLRASPERRNHRRRPPETAEQTLRPAAQAHRTQTADHFSAACYFSRLRRAEWGQHHHISGRYLYAYAGEMAWREDHRRVTNGEMFHAVIAASMAHPVSRVWKGYWQRAV